MIEHPTRGKRGTRRPQAGRADRRPRPATRPQAPPAIAVAQPAAVRPAPAAAACPADPSPSAQDESFLRDSYAATAFADRADRRLPRLGLPPRLAPGQAAPAGREGRQEMPSTRGLRRTPSVATGY